jgi:hypothetical protein
MSRLLRCISLSVLLLSWAGCASPGSDTGLSVPFVKKSQDETLRKQVEADSFPTAQQAGL